MYPAAHSRVTWFGDAYGNAEIWQVGCRLQGTTRPSSGQMAALIGAFHTRLATVTVAFPQSHRILGAKWSPQDVNGRYGDEGEAVESFLNPPVAGPQGIGFPQLAIVLSLRTERARGYASNGRMYIPSTPNITSDGRIAENHAAAIATAGAQFVQDVNAVGLGDVAVMSSVGTGRSERVTGVRVGRVVDTQRRRRNALEESYSTVAPVPS